MHEMQLPYQNSGGITIHHFIHEQPPVYSKFYDSMKKIATANFGDVYICNHIPTQTKRCIKVYHKEKLKNINQNSFEEEIELLSRLDHPNIMKVYEYFQDVNNFYLVTEYLSGGELFDFILENKNFNEKTVCRIMEQILSAINYLHRNNILHRDLKPENIMLGVKGDINSVKIIDFGTSKIFKDGEKLNVPIGTCYYMAPEMLKRAYDQRIDIWACGIIMYILLVGYPPFNGKDDDEIFKSIFNSPVVFDKQDWKDITPGAINLIMNLLEKNPDNRIVIDEIFNHNWFKRNFELTPINHSKVLNRLTRFSKVTKLENAVRMYIVQYYDLINDKEKLNSFFKAADENHDGMLDKTELLAICNKMGHVLDIEEFIRLADVNLDGKINYSEFLMAAVNFKKQASLKNLKAIFDTIDIDGSGFITKEEMGRFLNLKEGDHLVAELFKETDRDGNGHITFDEFLAGLKNIY